MAVADCHSWTQAFFLVLKLPVSPPPASLPDDDLVWDFTEKIENSQILSHRPSPTSHFPCMHSQTPSFPSC